MRPVLSIVVPCYNEEEAIPIFFEKMSKVLRTMELESYEFVFVDDGSKDGTLSVFESLVLKNECVHFVSFSRNFGKEAALYAGLEKVSGEYVAVMDADLQDPPSLLPQMLFAVRDEGFECAATRRITRKNEPIARSLFARLFYWIMGIMSDVPVVDGARDFRLMTTRYKNAVLCLIERNRFSKGLFPWVGFKTKWLEYENQERTAGKTKWSLWKLFLYSLDGIIGFSTKPLAFAAVAGILTIFVAVALITFIIVRRLVFDDAVKGWASTICVIVFFSGVQLFSLGICGLYIAKIYTEVKHRPMFIVQEEK